MFILFQVLLQSKSRNNVDHWHLSTNTPNQVCEHVGEFEFGSHTIIRTRGIRLATLQQRVRLCRFSFSQTAVRRDIVSTIADPASWPLSEIVVCASREPVLAAAFRFIDLTQLTQAT